MRRLFELHSNGAYSLTEDARHISFKFTNVVKRFVEDHKDYPLAELRLILSDALDSAMIQDSISRRLTADD